MARLIKWIFILFFMIGVLLGVLAANSIEDHALVAQPAQLSDADIKRVQHYIKSSNNPLNVDSGGLVKRQITEDDLRVLVNYVTLKMARGISRQLRVKTLFDPHLAKVQLTLRVARNPLGQYVNISTVLTENEDSVLELKALKIGEIEVPEFLTPLFASIFNDIMRKRYAEYELIQKSVKQIHFDKNQMTMTYVWSAQAERTIKAQIALRMLPSELKHALIDYADYLAKESHQFSDKTTLNDIFNTMFSYASLRNENNASPLNPVVENKAVFIALGAYILKRDIPGILGKKKAKYSSSESGESNNFNYKRIYLNGRHDLSKHFILSAAITSMADSEIAESMGVLKEVRDAKNGSGFSFIDLAADHAGIRLVREALITQQQAKEFQRLLANVKSESDYMLDVKNLPESIELSQFQKSYEDTKSEAYLKIEKIIKQRIDELPIYNREKFQTEK